MSPKPLVAWLSAIWCLLISSTLQFRVVVCVADGGRVAAQRRGTCGDAPVAPFKAFWPWAPFRPLAPVGPVAPASTQQHMANA